MGGTTMRFVWTKIFASAAVLAAHSSGKVVAANHDGLEPGDAQGSLI
jgi:hypothetical protein